MTYKRQRRMRRQMERNQEYTTQYFSFAVLGQGYERIDGIIIGLPGTIYEGHIITIQMTLPIQYPLKPPICKFKGKSFHPNISEDGKLCVEQLSHQWSPALTIPSLLRIIWTVLNEPYQYNDYLNCEAGKLYKEDRNAYEAKVKQALNYARQ